MRNSRSSSGFSAPGEALPPRIDSSSSSAWMNARSQEPVLISESSPPPHFPEVRTSETTALELTGLRLAFQGSGHGVFQGDVAIDPCKSNVRALGGFA